MFCGSAVTVPRAALSFVLENVDVARATGDCLREVQDRFELTTIATTELLLAAHRKLGNPRPAPGSIVRRLLDSDCEGSLPFATPMRFVPDRKAPTLDALETVSIGPVRIPRFGLGCMRLLSQGGTVGRQAVSAIGIPRSPEASRHALLNAVRVSGVRMIDLARGYGPWPGAAEGLVRDWFGTPSRSGVRYPPGLIIATKVGYRRENNGRWMVDLDPEFLKRELAESFAQFGAPIPLVYLVVRSTPTTPVVNRPRRLAKALAPLLEAQRNGTVVSLGIANVTAPEVLELCDAGPIDVVQNRFSLHSLADRGARAVIDRTAALGRPLVTWGLFGEGVKPPPPPPPIILETADALGVTPEELTIATILRVAPHLVPLPGAGRRATVDSSIAAAGLALPPSLVGRILGELG